MNQKVFYTAAGIAVILVFALTGLMHKARWPANAVPDPIPHVSTSVISEEGPGYVVNIAYPQFGVPKADAHIQLFVENAIVDFKKYFSEPGDSGRKNEYVGFFDEAYIGPDVVSARLTLSADTGGAHPISGVYGLNFNRETGEPLELKDALMMIGRTFDQIAGAAALKIAAEYGSVQFPEGIEPKPQNFSTFVVSKDAITSIFQEYQVVAYAYGTPEVRFVRVR